MDHDRASELLRPHARGELDAPELSELEEHLAACQDCSLELAAVRALTAEPEEPALSELERARLERTVAAAIAADPTVPVVTPAPGRNWSRIASVAGVAAMLVLAAVGITRLDLGGSTSDDAASGGALESADQDTLAEVGGTEIGQDAAGAGTESSAEMAAANGGPRARFDPDAGTFRTKDLKSFAARQAPFRTFAGAISAADAEGLGDDYLEAIQNATPSEEGKRLVRTCALQVMEQNFPMVPAYGAYGRFDGRDVLVLGFVYAPKGATLDRYLVWVWPRESCATPLKVIAGRIVR